MRRVQFIELHDQPWFPSGLRDEVTDALQCGSQNLKAYAPAYGLLYRALQASGGCSVVDLGSGSGGPWLDLSKKLRGCMPACCVWLTDKFPNRAAFETIQTASGNGVDFCLRPVDAMDVPAELIGLRTMFSSFHHFSPVDARAILQNAVNAKQGIAVFEITKRTASAAGMMFLWSLTPFLFAPTMRPFRWSRLFYTYLLPLVPLVLLFDGLVSCLRTYRVEELRTLVEDLGTTEYVWEIGEQPGTFGSLPITFLIGYPRNNVSAGRLGSGVQRAEISST